MFATIYVAALLTTAQPSIEQVQILNFYRPPLRGQDAPGLRCQALTYGDWVYATRSAQPSARVAFQRTAVAVTGQQTEGFFPVLLENGQRGWMEALGDANASAFQLSAEPWSLPCHPSR
jgi:hypothetical protein